MHCCAITGIVFGSIAAALGLLFVKPVNDAIVRYTQKHLDAGPTFATVQTAQFLAAVVQCASGSKPVMISCSRKSVPGALFTAAHGWKGVGIKALPDPGPPGLWHYSHAVVSKTINNPDLRRDPHFFVASSTEDWVNHGAVPKGFWPLVIQLDTSDPERIKRRTFMNDFFSSLMQPPALDLEGATGAVDAQKTNFQSASAAMSMVTSAVFKALFDFYPDQQTIEDVVGWIEKAGMAAANKYEVGSGPVMLERFNRIYSHVSKSAVGTQFLSKAAEIGFGDPKARLQEMVFITLFAGIGGTSDTVVAIQFHINNHPRSLKMFWKDPQAFIKEGARLYPAVAGMPLLAEKDYSVTLGNGRVYDMKKGGFYYNWNAGANVDPNVFGGSDKSESYAMEFDPARENLDQMMTFNGEIGAILKCKTSAGCAGTAARPCPGARLALHVAETVIKFLLPTEDHEVAMRVSKHPITDEPALLASDTRNSHNAILRGRLSPESD